MLDKLKKYTTKWRLLVGILAVIALIAGMVLAVLGDGVKMPQLLVAILLSLLLILLILWNGRFGKWLSVLFMVLLPIGALCAMECYTHVPQDLTVLIFIANLIFYYLLCMVFTWVTRKASIGYQIGLLIPMLTGTVNFFVVAFRSAPIVPWDIYSAGTAATVAGNYEFTASWKVFFVWMAFLWMLAIAGKLSIAFQNKIAWAIGSVCSIALLVGYVQAIQTDAVQENVGFDQVLFTPNVLYRNNGFFGAFLSNLRYLSVEKPDGYSEEAAEEIAGEVTTQTASADNKLPNVIVIMNEAFSDPDVYGEINTSEDYMPFLHSLEQSGNCTYGNLHVSVKGGNTANTEYEFLTGDSMAFVPVGSVPYQQYIHQTMPSLASRLNTLGYQTVAIHPYLKTGWNRQNVYQYFGFDEFVDKSSFTNPKIIRKYISDESAFDKIIEMYQNKEEGSPLFAFEVTMQNHGGYSTDFADFEATLSINSDLTQTKQYLSAERYLTLVQKTDEAFQKLTEYFEKQDEDTIIVLFGDHQPSDYITNIFRRVTGNTEDESLENTQTGYVVPFYIWSNFTTDHEYVEDISVNYLSTLLCEKAGIPLTGYQTWLGNLRKTIPVITSQLFEDTKGELYSLKSDELTKERNAYNILDYNHLVDEDHLISSFFE